MNPDLPLYEPDANAIYHLEIVAKLTGISSETIIYYREIGLIQACGNPDEFDVETLNKLGRIEHFRSAFETNLVGVKLILDLMDQVDRLKQELRIRH
jgi:DNA-binding transcriptional MerR regulator